MKLYVGNFVYTKTESELKRLFARHGEVVQVHIVSDHYTRQSKCFGYVEMSCDRSAEGAVRELHGKLLDERPLVVKKVRHWLERQESPW